MDDAQQRKAAMQLILIADPGVQSRSTYSNSKINRAKLQNTCQNQFKEACRNCDLDRLYERRAHGLLAIARSAMVKQNKPTLWSDAAYFNAIACSTHTLDAEKRFICRLASIVGYSAPG
eukprot:TRINITY_DN3462_c0_g1_i1.p2 TRINITY_DN3462_c0_g1~~TRINITY_DN3462_c0_g1_i1.p2  ORF type:complete len:119 (+),score=1.78 TRINITY_DN3462_c0_g1_i1:353-709(+)